MMNPDDTTALPKSKPSAEGGALYIVATPIGNLGDMTFRAVETLKQADVIACEDKRLTIRLLQHYDITTPMISYHDHSSERDRQAIVARLQAGESVALVSDAGTPLISDPGYRLVNDARAIGVSVVPIPGASSVMAALCGCGLPTDRFTFAGFLPNKAKARADAIAGMVSLPTTLVLLESPRRLVDCLQALQDGLGNREAAVCRELTKRFEELRRAPMSELAAHYTEHPPKGEVVLVIAPPEAKQWDDANIDQLLCDALATRSVKEAATHVAALTGRRRSALYQRALELKEGGANEPIH